MIKEINKNSKKIGEISNEEHEDPDYTDQFNSKANVDASNIGFGELFVEKKDGEGEVTYSADDSREDWGKALTNEDNLIASDNLTLVSSQNVYNETHPYMAKDGNDDWINPYHYINYKNLTRHEGAEDINKQDRWSEQDFFQPNEPNDNMVKENLIALDTAIWEVNLQLEEKANISLDNINYNGGLVINGIARCSVLVQDKTAFGEINPLVKVAYQYVQDPNTGLYTDVYTVYSDYEPEQQQQVDLSKYALKDSTNVGLLVAQQGSMPYKINFHTVENQLYGDNIKTRVANWCQAIGTYEEGMTSSDWKIKYKPADYTFSGSNASPDGSIEPNLDAYTVDLDTALLTCVGTVIYETRGEVEGLNVHFDGFDYNHEKGDTLCFVDEDYSVSGNVKMLNAALVKTVNGVNELWTEIHGNEGEGSPFFEDSNNLNSDDTWSWSYDANRQGNVTQDKELYFTHGNDTYPMIYSGIGYQIPLRVGLVSWLENANEILDLFNLKEAVLGENYYYSDYTGNNPSICDKLESVVSIVGSLQRQNLDDRISAIEQFLSNNYNNFTPYSSQGGNTP